MLLFFVVVVAVVGGGGVVFVLLLFSLPPPHAIFEGFICIYEEIMMPDDSLHISMKRITTFKCDFGVHAGVRVL